MKKSNFILLLVLVLTSLFVACDSSAVTQKMAADNNAQISRSVESGTTTADPGVMLHAYMWPFNQIKAALPEISAAGYKSIQTSPVQRTKEDGEWWLLYQPCNFDIGNYQLGSYEDFVSLCAEAENYGIKIIVDAVINHVADNGTDGNWSDAIDKYLKKSDWYHNKGTCTNYASRWNITQQNLGNLPDLNTQHPDVQNVIIGFLNKCVAAGADGFRFDAAKHIETNIGEDAYKSWSGNFWDSILGALNNKDNLYLVGEVLPDDGDNHEAYTNYFDITAHGYIWTVNNAVNSKNLTGISTIIHKDSELSPYVSMVYAENHDTYEHNETRTLSYYTRKMTSAILIARAGVVPRIFDRPAEELWKDADIIAINHFHNAMKGTSEYMRNPQNDVLIIDRGTIGTAIINVGGGKNITSTTNLAAGTYTNKATANATITSNGSQLSGYIPGGSIVVLYDDSNTPVVPEDPVVPDDPIVPTDPESNYTSMNVRGTFNTWAAGAMSLSDTNVWTTEISLEHGTEISYKFDAYGDWSTNWGDNNADGYAEVSGENISYTAAATGTYIVSFNDENRAYSISLSQETVPEDPVVPDDPIVPITVETTIKVHYNVGMGHSITVRGDTDPLSWTSGLATDWSDGNVWIVTLTDIAEGATVSFKPLINDSNWASGSNYSVVGGQTVDVYPNF
ncbi:MAG TPA: alpha-amylase family glycosyl hydrolase [Treponemataceae bacterium]|nr:alpha-amylase family glycosyl hydrolase [Treponemataceae bacterium]